MFSARLGTQSSQWFAENRIRQSKIPNYYCQRRNRATNKIENEH